MTSALVGAPEVATDTTKFPTTRKYTRRCVDLLVDEIRLLRPRAVVCLGVAPARLLASVVPQLDVWRRSSLNTLAEQDQRLVPMCRVGGVEFTAVVVKHPAAAATLAGRARNDALVVRAAAPWPHPRSGLTKPSTRIARPVAFRT